MQQNKTKTTPDNTLPDFKIDTELQEWVKWDNDLLNYIKDEGGKSWYEGTLDKLMDRYDLSGFDDNLGEQLATILENQITANPAKEQGKEVVSSVVGYTDEYVLSLQQTIEDLKDNVKCLKHNNKTACILAMEYGYKQCEKGENIQAAYINYNSLTTKSR